jgi:hypothetical protein
MKARHQILNIHRDPDNPFSQCKLGRQKFGEMLTALVSNYADGFVLAVNNPWGAGKTTFMTMWQHHLKKNGFPTIYFNAWENDFDNKPIVAILSEFRSLTGDSQSKTFQSVLEKGAILARNIAPALLKAVIKQVPGGEALADVAEGAGKAASELLEDEIKDFIKKKQTISEFREELETFVNELPGDLPLVFILDELDRCRPDYAVQVLENIKHLFSVRKVVFVLSIDKDHLESSIRGYYGSETIKASEYLRRFIDFEYSLPEPSTEVFVDYLYEYFGFDEFFQNQVRMTSDQLQNDGQLLKNMAQHVFTKSGATLRHQEQIFASLKVITGNTGLDHYVFPHIMLFLLYLRYMNPRDYKEIEQGKLTHNNLLDILSQCINPMLETHETDAVRIEAILLTLYNRHLPSSHQKTLYTLLTNGEVTSDFKSRFDQGSSRESLPYELRSFDVKIWSHRMSLKYLVNKINLVSGK